MVAVNNGPTHGPSLFRFYKLNLAQKFAYTVSILNIGAGLSGLLLGKSHFSGKVYKPLLHYFRFLPGHNPSAWWCCLLLLMASISFIALILRHDLWIRISFAILSGFWFWWSGVYFSFYPNHTSGPWGPWLTLVVVVGTSRPCFTKTLLSN